MPLPFRLALLASLTLLTACGGDAPVPADGQAAVPGTGAPGGTLHVYNWSDYIAEDTVAQFQAATGVPRIVPVTVGS